MDILKVGNSLGAGAIALKKKGRLYRLDFPEEGTYKMIVNGPLRSIFELGYNNWKMNGHSYNIIHRISIWGGAQFYKSEVTVSGFTGDETLVTGIVKHCDSLIVRMPNAQYTLLATHFNLSRLACSRRFSTVSFSF